MTAGTRPDSAVPGSTPGISRFRSTSEPLWPGRLQLPAVAWRLPLAAAAPARPELPAVVPANAAHFPCAPVLPGLPVRDAGAQLLPGVCVLLRPDVRPLPGRASPARPSAARALWLQPRLSGGRLLSPVPPARLSPGPQPPAFYVLLPAFGPAPPPAGDGLLPAASGARPRRVRAPAGGAAPHPGRAGPALPPPGWALVRG